MSLTNLSEEQILDLIQSAVRAGREEGEREGWHRGYADGQRDEAARRGDAVSCKTA